MKKYNLKDILIPIISLVLIAGLLVFIFLTFTNILSSYDKVSKYSNNIAIYQDNIVRLQGISQTNLDKKLSDQNKIIPIGGDVANLVNNTINLAKSYGLDAQQDLTSQSSTQSGSNQKNNSTQTTEKKSVGIEELQSGDLEFVPEGILIDGLVYPINLSITVKGTKENIVTFIQNVSTQERILNVQQTELTQTPTKDTSNYWIGKVTIYAYTVADQKVDSRTVKKITDPLDPKLLDTPKKINTNF